MLQKGHHGGRDFTCAPGRVLWRLGWLRVPPSPQEECRVGQGITGSFLSQERVSQGTGHILGGSPWCLSLLGRCGTDAGGGLSFPWLRWLCNAPQARWGRWCDLVYHRAAAGGSPGSGSRTPALCHLQHKSLCVWDLLFFLLPLEGFKTIIMFSSLCQAEKCRNVDAVPLGKKFFGALLLADLAVPPHASGSVPAPRQLPRNSAAGWGEEPPSPSYPGHDAALLPQGEISVEKGLEKLLLWRNAPCLHPQPMGTPACPKMGAWGGRKSD